MSKYIKSFKTKAEYNAYIAGEHATPYTAYVEEEDKYYYGAKEPDWMEAVTSFSGTLSDANQLFTDISVPTGVTSFNTNNTVEYTNLVSLSLPDSFTVFSAMSAGYTCVAPELAKITVDSGNSTFDSRDNCNAIIKTSTNSLYYGCKNTVIPNTVTAIDTYAFYKNTGLTSITIPDSVTSIGGMAFFDCTSLASVTILATTPPSMSNYNIHKETFKNNASGRKIYVPAESVNTYKTESRWSYYASAIEAIPSA